MAGWTCVADVSQDDVPESMLRKPDASLLKTTGDVVTERLCSHNLRTLCPVTGQPDWGTLLIEYEGPRGDHASLFLYIISLRTETGFHENAVESAFLAITRRCAPQGLTVRGMFLRRGGIDICPVRCTPGWDDAAKAIGAPQTRAPRWLAGVLPEAARARCATSAAWAAAAGRLACTFWIYLREPRLQKMRSDGDYW